MVTKDIRQDGARMVIDGMPQPALVLFLVAKAPHLGDLSFPSGPNVDDDLVWGYSAQQRAINRFQRGFFFLSSHSTVSVLMRNTRAVSQIPVPLRLISMRRLL